MNGAFPHLTIDENTSQTTERCFAIYTFFFIKTYLRPAPQARPINAHTS